MAKLTKLQVVQRVLSLVDSDNVLATSDTVESEQVSDFLNIVYDDVVAQWTWPHLKELTQLEVTATAHQMLIPTGIYDIFWLRYNKKDIGYLTPYEMTDLLDTRDTTLSEIDSNGAYNDRDPQYYTSYDDENIIFDSYNSSLQKNLSNIYVSKQPATLSTDATILDLPERFHNVIVHGVAEIAFDVLKDDTISASKHGRFFKRGKVSMKNYVERINNPDKTTKTYGRTYERK